MTITLPAPVPVPSSHPSSSTLVPARKIAAARLRPLAAEEEREWGDRIRQLSREGRPEEALFLLREMMLRPDGSRRRRPNGAFLSAALRSCADLGAVDLGREVHAFLVRNDAGCPVHRRHMETSLVDFYGRCGLLLVAHLLFDRMPEKDVIAWTAMVNASASGTAALFRQMLCCGVEPNAHTLTAVLRQATLQYGRQIHCLAVKRNLHSGAFAGNSLVGMYAKHGEADCAERVFHGIRGKDAACFNSLLAGRGRRGSATGLVAAFRDMGLAGVSTNQATYLSLLSACAELALPSLAAQLHAQVLATGVFLSDETIPAALLNAYAKSGDLGAARVVFRQLQGGGATAASVGLWNSMIGAYGKHGRGRDALQSFEEMVAAGTRPDHITFTCLLSACSHCGMVDEGRRLFRLMTESYGIAARPEHFGCMVDLLGRARLTREAREFVEAAEAAAGGEIGGAAVWGALLSWCKERGDVEGAEAAAGRLMEVEPGGGGAYVALAAAYAASGRWGDAAAVRKLMERRGVKKTAGSSWTEAGLMVHSFRAGENPGE